METAKKRRWGMLVCTLLSVMLVMALVPQAAWAEVAAESADAAQTGVTTTDTDGTNDQTDGTEDGGKSEGQGDTSGDQGDQADNQGTQGSQNADSSVQQSKAGNAMVLSAMDGSDTADGTDASSHVHCTITSSATTFSSGDTGDFKVSYKIEPGSIKEGDTLTVQLPKSIARTAKLYVSSQHFKSKQDNGDGTWTLTFGSDASTALTGTFEMFVTMATVASETNGDISVGNDSLTVKVLPTAPQDSQQGSGKPDYVIRKDIDPGNDVSPIGYYYFDNGNGVQAYKRDMTDTASTKFRLLVNEKQITMSGVTVTDTLPDGMTFDTSTNHGIEVKRYKKGYDVDPETVDPSLYDIAISGNILTFTYHGELSDSVVVSYWASTPAGSNGNQYVNRADINYVSNGASYANHRLCSLEGTSYSAANGTKMVDKTELYLDDDQQVTYTFKFWNNNGFNVGDISLRDKLNPYVDYKFALDNDKFSVTWDETGHFVTITNTSPITKDDVEYVSFVTDFSRVPGDTQVSNSVANANSYNSATGTYTIYGNTVYTYRYKAYRVPQTDDTTDDNNGGDTDTTNDDNQTDTTNDDGDQTETTDDNQDRTTDTTNDDNQTKKTGTTDTTEEQTSTTTTETKTAAATQQPTQAPKQESVHQDAAPKGSLPQTGDVSSPVLPVLIAGLLVLAVACALRVHRQDRV